MLLNKLGAFYMSGGGKLKKQAILRYLPCVLFLEQVS